MLEIVSLSKQKPNKIKNKNELEVIKTIIKVGNKYYGIKSLEAENRNHDRIRVIIEFYSWKNLIEVCAHYTVDKLFYDSLKEFNVDSKYHHNQIPDEANMEEFKIEIVFYNEKEQAWFISGLFKDFDFENCKYSIK